MDNLESKMQAILERNAKVEADKGWETSFARRACIFVITYAGALFLFWFNDLPKPLMQAFIPSCAYLISTFTLPSLKKWWLKKHS